MTCSVDKTLTTWLLLCPPLALLTLQWMPSCNRQMVSHDGVAISFWIISIATDQHSPSWWNRMEIGFISSRPRVIPALKTEIIVQVVSEEHCCCIVHSCRRDIPIITYIKRKANVSNSSSRVCCTRCFRLEEPKNADVHTSRQADTLYHNVY